MPALAGLIPVLSTPLDDLVGAFPGEPSTLDVPVSAGIIDGIEIDAETLSFTAAGAGEFSRDLVSVDPATGALTITAGADTDDQDPASAAKPALPAGEVELFTALVSDTAVTSIEQAERGDGLETDPVLTVGVGAGTINGVYKAATSVVFSASSSAKYAKDLVTIDADGNLAIVAGTEADTEEDAVLPSVPANKWGLFSATVGDATEGVTALNLTVRGADPAASS